MDDSLDRPQLLAALLAACREAGTRRAFALRHGLSPSYLTDVLRQRRAPGDKILAAIGIERVVTYRRAAR